MITLEALAEGLEGSVLQTLNRVCVCVRACVCVCVSYRSKGVRDNSRRFTHISKKKIATAAVGPFIS